MFTARPAVSLQAIRMPTNKMIRPMIPCAGSARSRNGDANPITVRTPSALSRSQFRLSCGCGVARLRLLFSAFLLCLLLSTFLLHLLGYRNGNRSHGDSCVCQQNCGHLIAATADAARAKYDRFPDDITDGERHKADYPTGGEGEPHIQRQAQDRAAHAEANPAHKRRMRVNRHLILDALGAGPTDGHAIRTVIGTGYRFAACLAERCAGLARILGGRELRHSVAHLLLHAASGFSAAA